MTTQDRRGVRAEPPGRAVPGRREATAAVLVLAKEPVPGRVKTRLHAGFTPVQAGALAAAALHDTLAAVAAAPVGRRVLVLEGRPGGWVPPSFEVLPQRGDGLDERLAAAFDDAALLGPGPHLLIGMDTPQVTPALLDVDWRGCDAVLGLSTDGGYWAVGLRTPCPQVFHGVPMSTDGTGEAQLERLRSLGLRVRLLEPLTDVDTPGDARRVARSAPGSRFARTHAELTAPAPGRDLHPLTLFEAALAGHPVTATDDDVERLLDVARWEAEPDDLDRLMISRCEVSVLDIGCGPGRLVTAASERGLASLGVDVSAVAVELTRRRGGAVLRRRVQDRLPGEHRWGTVLLADGNIGIGGDPDAMLSRCRELLRPGGLLLVEADPDDDADSRSPVVLRAADGRVSSPLPWARLGARALGAALARNDFGVVEEWRACGRVLLGARSLSTT